MYRIIDYDANYSIASMINTDFSMVAKTFRIMIMSIIAYKCEQSFSLTASDSIVGFWVD